MRRVATKLLCVFGIAALAACESSRLDLGQAADGPALDPATLAWVKTVKGDDAYFRVSVKFESATGVNPTDRCVGISNPLVEEQRLVYLRASIRHGANSVDEVPVFVFESKKGQSGGAVCVLDRQQRYITPWIRMEPREKIFIDYTFRAQKQTDIKIEKVSGALADLAGFIAGPAGVGLGTMVATTSSSPSIQEKVRAVQAEVKDSLSNTITDKNTLLIDPSSSSQSGHYARLIPVLERNAKDPEEAPKVIGSLNFDLEFRRSLLPMAPVLQSPGFVPDRAGYSRESIMGARFFVDQANQNDRIDDILNDAQFAGNSEAVKSASSPAALRNLCELVVRRLDEKLGFVDFDRLTAMFFHVSRHPRFETDYEMAQSCLAKRLELMEAMKLPLPGVQEPGLVAWRRIKPVVERIRLVLDHGLSVDARKRAVIGSLAEQVELANGTTIAAISDIPPTAESFARNRAAELLSGIGINRGSCYLQTAQNAGLFVFVMPDDTNAAYEAIVAFDTTGNSPKVSKVEFALLEPIYREAARELAQSDAQCNLVWDIVAQIPTVGFMARSERMKSLEG